MFKFLKYRELCAIGFTVLLWLAFCYGLAYASPKNIEPIKVGCKYGEKPTQDCGGALVVFSYVDNDASGTYSYTADAPNPKVWFYYAVSDTCDTTQIRYASRLKTDDDGDFIFPGSVGCMLFSPDGPITITTTHYYFAANIHEAQVGWVYLPYRPKAALEPTNLGDTPEPLNTHLNQVYLTNIVR